MADFMQADNPNLDRQGSSYLVRKQLKQAKHLQSASLEDQLAPFQVDRQGSVPCLPEVLLHLTKAEEDLKESAGIVQPDAEALKELFPKTWGQPYVRLVTDVNANSEMHQPLRIAVVLSGGQAAGGHNVIAGVYDYIKKCNPNSQLLGFIGGPEGIYTNRYVNVDDDMMDRFRNQGGFDMIRSGRHKIESAEHKKASMQNCTALGLDGLVVIGGDDSNTNAAILAEYFKANDSNTRVVGCPKTIDGDLKNQFVETSFGFDTAVKTFSEFVGNLCTDVATSGKYYHFVRVMGRSASHIAMECAMQCRPNMVLIGEEIQEKKIGMKELVDEIVEMIVKRHKMGRNYGVILVPEGLIEFSVQIGQLIREINDIVAKGPFDEAQLTESMRTLFLDLPVSIRNELLLERDPHGNVQVAKIATERLLILMVDSRLRAIGHFDFSPKAHYFGYEGRCGMPSLFDSNYCYALGFVAGTLVDRGYSGYMATIRGLDRPVQEWKPAGCPMTIMMNLERRHGKDKPVIKKHVVELDGELFKLLAQVREEWKYRDVYRSPGPLQFAGPHSEASNYTIKAPTLEELLPKKPSNFDELAKRRFFVKSEEQMSHLEHQRLTGAITLCPQLQSTSCGLKYSRRAGASDPSSHHAVIQAFPLQVAQHKGRLADMARLPTPYQSSKALRVGIVLTGQQAPGVANVVWGLVERLSLHDIPGTVIGFLGGGKGLMATPPRSIEITAEDMRLTRNQGGFDLLGRDPDSERIIAAPESLSKIRDTCCALNLDGLVLIGGRWTLTDVSVIAENFLAHQIPTRVIGVPATQNNNLDDTYIEASLGFDSASKCYSALIGNLLTDSASATKYWYFIRLMGRDKSQVALEAALQTHPNLTLVSELYAGGDKSIEDCVTDIADVVCRRADTGKHFGAVLIPEGLISALPQFRQLVKEVSHLLQSVSAPSPGDDGSLAGLSAEEQAIYDELTAQDISSSSKYVSQLSPWSLAVLKTLPQYFRKQIVQPRSVGRLQLSQIATEELLSQLVQEELKKRAVEGSYKGVFSPVCFYFGYQGRSSLPSKFDCTLGLSHGFLAGVCVESKLTGYVTSMRGLCGPTSKWRPYAFPVTSIAKLQAETDNYAEKVPMVGSSMVKVDGKPLRKVLQATQMWEAEDVYCNPGPIQFTGPASHYYARYLFEEHHDYLNMLSKVGQSLDYLRALCNFGVDKSLLRSTSIALESLVKIVARDDSDERGDEYTHEMKAIDTEL